MTSDLSRRHLLQLMGLGTGAAALASVAPGLAWAQTKDTVTIAWPTDVPTWDPNQRTFPDGQALFKLIFEQPIMQDPKLNFVPGLFTEWTTSEDGLSLGFKLREGVKFHDGSPLTNRDIRFNWFDRVKESLSGGNKLDAANTWKNIQDIELDGDYAGTFRFGAPFTTAVPWLAFMANYVVPEAYIKSVGIEQFRAKPIGTGPYKLVEYQVNSRMVFERNEDYWGEKPAIKTVVVNIIKDPSARAAAMQSGQADLTVNIPVRETERLGKVPGLVSELNPIQRVVLIQLRSDLATADQNLRLALHHAIDKQALSKAFYGGGAVPLSVPAPPGTSGDVPGFVFPYDPEKSKALLAASGYGPGKPATLKMAATNGHFPSDFDIARALVGMWKKVGIEVELETIEYAKYFELNRGGQLPELTLYSWENATGDPEIFTGYLLNPKMPFSPWRGEQPGDQIAKLFVETNTEKRLAGYRELNRFAVEMGATIPLLQSVQTLVRKDNLNYLKFGNGWVLAQTMTWS